MITIICATNRPKAQTLRIVEKYEEILKEKGQEVSILRMNELPENFVVSDSYGSRTPPMEQIIETRLEPSDRLVIISPEYNGSYPGIFKTFLDGLEPKLWFGKKVALVGVASGRAGNQRGMDHLTDVLHHLRMEVFSLKLPISQLHTLTDDTGTLVDEPTLDLLNKQAQEFLDF